MNRQKVFAIAFYKRMQPSIIDDSEMLWWHTFAKEKSIAIIKEIIIPELDYRINTNEDLQIEVIWWEEIITYINEIQI